jgi:hypothetical protein
LSAHSHRSSTRPLVSVRRTAFILLLLAAAIAAHAPAAGAAATPMVDLGTASSYATISGASIGNTVSADGAPHTILRGDVGVAVATQPLGFPPGVITGSTNIGNAAAVQAHLDVVAAYVAILARSGGAPRIGALAGATITPGLHTIGGAASNTGTVTLDAGGDPNAVFVFQINGALAFAAGSHVTLAGGAQAARVFWQVNGAGAIGAGSTFAGTLIAMDAVAVGNGSLFNGRAFARNGALTLDADEFYSSPPIVTITGGATAYTTTMNPTISGSTDLVAPALVTVTVNGQTLTTVPSAGAWSVTPPTIANGVYPVTATVTDGAGNASTASQLLTVDTVLPIVIIDGGATVATNDPTPTISGFSDVTAGTLVQVDVDAQTLLALVQPGGAWNVTPAALLDGTRTVALSVHDAAGNGGVDTQQLTVDTTAPAATIAGGPTALSNDTTPLLAGTAAVAAGMTVTVNLADETLVAVVGADGSWTAEASTLAEGAHRIVMTTADAAGNNATFTQWLTIDTTAPAITIAGGAAAGTTALTPTIMGTSDAAAGSTVTVTIAGQTMTTLVQRTGTWNATPTPVGLGTWPVVASTPDPAGNIGTASQTLTITTTSTITTPLPTGSATLNVSAATVGTTLRATVHWSRPATATYRWLRDGAAIAGATTPTYTVSTADLGRVLWLVASVAETGRSVHVTTPRVTPRASSTLSLTANSANVKAGKVIIIRGALHSAALPARRTVRVTILQKVGARWVPRRSVSVQTTVTGAFAVSYRVPAGRRGAWRARAVFTGVAAQRPATSPFAAFTAR